MKSSTDLHGARVTTLGIEFPSAPLPADVWRSMLGEAVRNRSTSCWRIGDLLNHGESAGYGKTYDQAVIETGLGLQTVANLKWVAGKVEFSRRREILSFAHHAEVAALPPAEQDRLLDLASKAGWSRDVLREQVTKLRARTDGEGDNSAAMARSSAVPSYLKPSTSVTYYRTERPVPPAQTIRAEVTEHPVPAPRKIHVEVNSVPPGEVLKGRSYYEPPKLSRAEAMHKCKSLARDIRHLPEMAQVVAAIDAAAAAFEQDKPLTQAGGGGGAPTFH